MADLRTPSKTINRKIAAFVELDVNYAASAGNYNATSKLTTILTTAGDNNQSVPLQVAINYDTIGLLVNANHPMKLSITDNNDNVVEDANGNNIYARLTHSGGVYTLTSYYDNNGTETAVNLPAGDYLFHVAYNFDFHTLPHDAFIKSINLGINDGSNSAGVAPTEYRVAVETHTISTQNSVANLAQVPVDATKVKICMKGWSGLANEGAITVTGQSVVFNAGTVGFDLAVGESYWYEYEYAS